MEDRTAPATFTVTGTGDNNVAGTLRFAVNNLVAGEQNIIQFNLVAPATITLTQSLSIVSKHVDFIGPGRSGVTIAGSGTFRNAFPILNLTGPTTDVLIGGLNFQNGWNAAAGGAIRADGVRNLTISNCVFVGNMTSASGGAVYALNVRSLSIIDTKFTGNEAHGANGGAVYTISATSINTTTVIWNSVFTSNEASDNGGAAMLAARGNADITYSTFSETNIASEGFGGALCLGPAVIALVDDSTFEGNQAHGADGGGGAISNLGGNGVVRNSTFYNNTAVGSGGAVADYQRRLGYLGDTVAGNSAALGGGIWFGPNPMGMGTIANCIIAGNTAVTAGPDVSGPARSDGHNIIGVGTGSTGWNANNGDQVGANSQNAINPRLNSLGYYGGTTQTMTLQVGSPALDAGDNTKVTTIRDQRGYTRIVNGTVDIGAVEMQASELLDVCPSAYDVDFYLQLGETLTVDGLSSSPTLLDYSGNGGNSSVFISQVNGQAANVGAAIPTTLGGTLTLNGNGTFTYVAPANVYGDDSATYTTSNGASTRTGTLTFHVVDVTAFAADYSTLKSGTLTVSTDSGLLQYADAASGASLSVTAVNGSAANVGTNLTLAHGTLNVTSTGSFTFIPTTGYLGDQAFTFTVSDGIQSSTATATIHVVQVLATDAEYSILHDHELNSNTSWGLLHYVSEADANTLSISAVNGSAAAIGVAITTDNGGRLTVQPNGSFVYDPPSHFAGEDWFSYTATDGTYTSTATVILHVTNQAPTGTPALYSASKNTTLTVPIAQSLVHYGSDADGDTLSLVAVNGNASAVGSAVVTSQGGSVTVQADGTFVYTPATNFTGNDTFTFTLSDGIATVTITCTINVM